MAAGQGELRQIVQPGPASADRIEWAAAHGRVFSMVLDEGLPLLEAVRRGFAAAGFTSGVARIDGLALSPFAYVMPALSKTPEHAAFYSETFRPAGTTVVERGSLTFGLRDGAPFFHCHGLWTEGDDRPGGGHVLPAETELARTIIVQAVGLDGAAFVAKHDAETNFTLFGPTGAPLLGASRQGRFYALRVKPNVDLIEALEGFCRAQGLSRATVHGGVGSTIGARFADGRAVENFATEVAITRGQVTADGSGSEIEVALVDFTGARARGSLKRGDNPVLMTFELVLEAG